MSELTIVGKSIPKIDAKLKVTGQAIYADDLRFPGLLYGKIVRCWDYAHAKVKNIDISEAIKLPGVIKILRPSDITKKKYCSGVLDLMAPPEVSKNILGDIEDQPIFADHVKHQGDGICGIIAISEEIAVKAAKLIKVDYEPLPVYLNSEQSAKPDVIQFASEKPGNLAFQLPIEMFPDNAYGWGDVEAGFKQADIIVEDTFYLPKVKQCQMEPHSYVAMYDSEERLNLWTSTQMPKCVHIKIARLFELPMTRVKINQTVIGGGFGARLGMINEPQVCAMAMAVPGCHIKITQLREEDWVASETRHSGKYWIKMGFKKDGTPVAIDAATEYLGGGYYTHASGVPFTTGAWLIGMYKYGACRYKGARYYTNTVPCGAYRGYGNPQTNFALEQIIDKSCNKLGIDPVEWRLKWHKGVGDDGWCLGVPYPSCALDECLKRGAKAIKWDEKRKKYAGQNGVKRRGIGVAVMNHTSGAMPMLLEHTACTVKINEDASAEIIISCSDLGTGAHTALKQIAAEALGFPLDDVHIKAGDSDASGFDIGAHASRTIYVGGTAVIQACEEVKKEIIKRSAKQLQVKEEQLEVKDKKVFVKENPDKFITVQKIAFEGVYNYMNPQTGERIGAPGQLQGYASYFPPSNSPPFAAAFVEVEVDIETGEVKVIEVVNAHDIGRAIHPPSVEGQLEGGIQQALGMALTEEMSYDNNGLCLNNSFTDYKMPGSTDMPKCKIIMVEKPDPLGPFGAKSVGESGLVAPTGATANAIYHALGIQILECPITPERILNAIKNKGIK